MIKAATDLRSPNQIAISKGVKASSNRRRREALEATESQIHRAVAEYLSRALKPPTMWTTIGHGGGGYVRGAQLKAMGVQPGWPDIIVLVASGHAPHYVEVIGIELKARKGSQSDEQKAVQKSFDRVGATYALARSLDDVVAILDQHNVPLHARPSP